MFFIGQKKQLLTMKNRKINLNYDENGITFVMSIFDLISKTNYNNIKDIVFRITDDYDEHTIFLNDFPEIEFHENPWFINRIFTHKITKKNFILKEIVKVLIKIP